MPIVFVHGVANREGQPLWDSRGALERMLRHYVSPKIAAAGDPDAVEMFFPYWGDLGAAFAWGGISRPTSAFLGHGPQAVGLAEQARRSAEYADTIAHARSAPSVAPGGGWVAHGAGGGAPLDLADLDPDALSDLACTLLQRGTTDAEGLADATIAADAVAHDPETTRALKELPPGDAQVDDLTGRVEQALQGRFTGQGARFTEFRARLGETVSRALGLPGWLTTQVLSEIRPPLHAALTTFFGDVFCYLGKRGGAAAPGEIPLRVLDDLRRADAIKRRTGEPIVVLSHSMGGQIVFDLVTAFLPVLAPNLKIDHWTASASQVGLMEELRLFLRDDREYGAASDDPNKRLAPNPIGPNLGGWWNVWDPNDFLSFTCHGIFADVDDHGFDSGLSVVTAHSGYLVRPSFYRLIAGRL